MAYISNYGLNTNVGEIRKDKDILFNYFKKSFDLIIGYNEETHNDRDMGDNKLISNGCFGVISNTPDEDFRIVIDYEFSMDKYVAVSIEYLNENDKKFLSFMLMQLEGNKYKRFQINGEVNEIALYITESILPLYKNNTTQDDMPFNIKNINQSYEDVFANQFYLQQKNGFMPDFVKNYTSKVFKLDMRNSVAVQIASTMDDLIGIKEFDNNIPDYFQIDAYWTHLDSIIFFIELLLPNNDIKKEVVRIDLHYDSFPYSKDKDKEMEGAKVADLRDSLKTFSNTLDFQDCPISYSDINIMRLGIDIQLVTTDPRKLNITSGIYAISAQTIDNDESTEENAFSWIDEYVLPQMTNVFKEKYNVDTFSIKIQCLLTLAADLSVKYFADIIKDEFNEVDITDDCRKENK